MHKINSCYSLFVALLSSIYPLFCSTAQSNLQKTCDGLGIYYKNTNRDDYHDENGIGLFTKWFKEEEMEIEDMDEELQDDNVEDCSYIDFDDNFPFLNLTGGYDDEKKSDDDSDDKKRIMLNTIQHCYKHGEPPLKYFSMPLELPEPSYFYADKQKMWGYSLLGENFCESSGNELIYWPDKWKNIEEKKRHEENRKKGCCEEKTFQCMDLQSNGDEYALFYSLKKKPLSPSITQSFFAIPLQEETPFIYIIYVNIKTRKIKSEEIKLPRGSLQVNSLIYIDPKAFCLYEVTPYALQKQLLLQKQPFGFTSIQYLYVTSLKDNNGSDLKRFSFKVPQSINLQYNRFWVWSSGQNKHSVTVIRESSEKNESYHDIKKKGVMRINYDQSSSEPTSIIQFPLHENYCQKRESFFNRKSCLLTVCYAILSSSEKELTSSTLLVDIFHVGKDKIVLLKRLNLLVALDNNSHNITGLSGGISDIWFPFNDNYTITCQISHCSGNFYIIDIKNGLYKLIRIDDYILKTKSPKPRKGSMVIKTLLNSEKERKVIIYSQRYKCVLSFYSPLNNGEKIHFKEKELSINSKYLMASVTLKKP